MPSTPNTFSQLPHHEGGSQDSPFEVLDRCHLLVTTSSHVYGWDRSGVEILFESQKHGVVAAREAQDGSGMLAVANKHVVILHDTKRGYERSWGLQANEDEVRQLIYTADAKSLFLSTNLTPDIQQYSTNEAKLLSPARAHASPPIALAISPTGRLMVSASDGPPVVYLHHLHSRKPPVLVEPRASRAAVAVAAFHPERGHTFLLAFRDGTAVVYDASRILKSGSESQANQESVNNGEVGRLCSLHRATSHGSRRAAITGAAFLPGFKTRVVTVGNDGRCRLVDFADGGATLRTWHTKAPATCVSVLSIPSATHPSTNQNHVVATDSPIAVGRADGVVQIFDSVGLCLCERTFSEHGEKIISTEWIGGPSPRPLLSGNVSSVQQVNGTPLQSERQAVAKNMDPKTKLESLQRSIAGNDTSALAQSAQSTEIPANTGRRMFAVHPDEAEDGTVRHTRPQSGLDLRLFIADDYQDLFSPAKSSNNDSSPTAPDRRVASPSRVRPALTSQTFLKSPEPAVSPLSDTMSRRRNLVLFPSTESDSGDGKSRIPIERQSTGLPRKQPVSASRRRSTTVHQKNNGRPANRLGIQIESSQRKKVSQTLAGQSDIDLAQHGVQANPLETTHQSKQEQAKPVIVPNTHIKNRRGLFRRPTDHIETDLDSDTARETYDHVHRKHKWPEDSNQHSSFDGNVWPSSDTSGHAHHTPTRRHHRATRPPARQGSRSRVTSKGTVSTNGMRVGGGAALPTMTPAIQKMDGSTDEEMFSARTHVTSSGTFTPSSKDVRELFPRSSSLSPSKARGPRKHGNRAAGPTAIAQAALLSSAIATREVKSPWARARASKNVDRQNIEAAEPRQEQIFVKQANRATSIQKENLSKPHCKLCAATAAKVLGLESEVTRLKGAVLLCTTALRQQGIRVPKLSKEKK